MISYTSCLCPWHRCILWFMQELQGPPSEERAHGTVSLKTYYKYFRAGGNCLFLLVFVVILFVAEVSPFSILCLSVCYYCFFLRLSCTLGLLSGLISVCLSYVEHVIQALICVHAQQGIQQLSGLSFCRSISLLRGSVITCSTWTRS